MRRRSSCMSSRDYFSKARTDEGRLSAVRASCKDLMMRVRESLLRSRMETILRIKYVFVRRASVLTFVCEFIMLFREERFINNLNILIVPKL